MGCIELVADAVHGADHLAGRRTFEQLAQAMNMPAQGGIGNVNHWKGWGNIVGNGAAMPRSGWFLGEKIADWKRMKWTGARSA